MGTFRLWAFSRGVQLRAAFVVLKFLMILLRGEFWRAFDFLSFGGVTNAFRTLSWMRVHVCNFRVRLGRVYYKGHLS